MLTCLRCGEENAEGARFCAACGARLTAAPGREVRKTVTVLFADVTGSTALGEQLDPESLRRVMARYFDVARTCLERQGGTVEKFIGDAVMAVFGVPIVHEDDALRALRAAADLRDSLASLNDELERDYGVALQLRTGVNTGEVVTGTEERLATGDPVNVAARLEQAAQPGDILVGEPTVRLARDAIEVEPVEALELKGKAEPLPAYRLLRVVEDAPAFDRRLDAALVGRREELARVRAAFEATVSERRCRLVTVLGAPGIGKSRLAREIAGALRGKAAVFVGRCLPYGEGITYWPLREIFASADAEEELETALGQGAPEEIFWEVRKALERRAREQPLVLLVEDIHWAEPTLLDLIEHLAEWTRDAPLLLLCLSRPELLDERPGWPGECFSLDPLSEAESDELIGGLIPASPLDEPTRERIRKAAEGNPLFVEQLIAVVAEGGALDRIPPTIQALLEARLDALPEAERDVLERAAVIGLEFEWAALAELDRERRRPAGTELAALVRKELIRSHDVIEDTFQFRHILIRDAAYQSISKDLRADLHERFAGWLDGRGEEFDEIVGYHLEQAYRSVVALGPAGERSRLLARRAADRLAASGLRANARGEPLAAADLLERASSLLPPDDPRRLSLLPSLGRALREGGEMERAEGVLTEAVERGRAAGMRLVAADAAVSLTDLRFHRPAHTGVGREDVLRELAAAVQVFEELGDEAGLGRALCFRGKVSFWAGDSTAAIEDLELAVKYSGAVGDEAQEAETLQYVLTALYRGSTPVEEALERVAEIESRAGTNRRLERSALASHAVLEAMLGHFDAARDLIGRARALAEELGLEATLAAQVTTGVGEIELLAGDPEAAERELRPACETLERIGELGYLSSAAPPLADALYLQGRDDEAFLVTERWDPKRLTVPEDVDAQVGWLRVRAKLLARRGDFEAAERLAREATARTARTDFLDLHARAVADLAEVLRLAGRSEESAAAVQEAIRLYEQKGNIAAAAALETTTSMPTP